VVVLPPALAMMTVFNTMVEQGENRVWGPGVWGWGGGPAAASRASPPRPPGPGAAGGEPGADPHTRIPAHGWSRRAAAKLNPPAPRKGNPMLTPSHAHHTGKGSRADRRRDWWPKLPGALPGGAGSVAGRGWG
jgi:hypothetical protein